MASRLRLYTRKGCGLCDEMLAQAEPIAQRFGLTIDTVDIDADADLRDRYNTLIPVLVLDQTEVCHHFFDQAALERALTGMSTHG